MSKETRKRCVVVMYDTLCRHFIPTYGNEWVKAPNFERLAKRSVQFNNFYVGSMPCMPARREMHTGRYNFLHRSWGPLEPFDDRLLLRYEVQRIKDPENYKRLIRGDFDKDKNVKTKISLEEIEYVFLKAKEVELLPFLFLS